MAQRDTILFISAPVGSGHIRAAQAVSAAIKDLSPDTDTVFADLFDFISPCLSGAVLSAYLKVLDFFPQLYGLVYNWGNTSRIAGVGREVVSRYLAKRMRQYIHTHHPSAIVCTHAAPAGLVAYLCKTTNLPVPTFAIITDFVIHRLWVYPEFDRYFVHHDGMRDFLADYGIECHRSHAFGIPVSRKFSQTCDHKQVLQALDLRDDRKTILIMGGGAGLLPMAEIVAACEELTTPLQIIAVTGSNSRLCQKLLAIAPALTYSIVRPLGSVDNIHELMAAADLLISKPGGMTSAEALCRGVPMIIYRPIPGQEEANSRYLLEHEAARSVSSVADLKTLLNTLIRQPDLLAKLGRQAASLGKPAAAADISEIILATIHNTKT